MEQPKVVIEAGTTPSLQEQMEEAVQNANQAAETAEQAAEAAGEYVEEHMPYIGNDGYWYVWDKDQGTSGAYVKKVDATGDEGKANKQTGATVGNVATFQSGGDIQDSNVPLSDLAHIDGYYETMSVGSANNINGRTTVKAYYVDRMTGGETAEVSNGVAMASAFEGNGCAWNQLVRNGDFSDGTTGWTCYAGNVVSVQNNEYIVTLANDPTGNAQYGVVHSNIDVISGHKYYTRLFVYVPKNGNFVISPFGSGTYPFTPVVANKWNLATNLYTVGTTASVNPFTIFPRIKDDGYVQGDSFKYKNVCIFDLTLLGIDYMTTTDEVEEWLANNIGLKPYYAYNAGTLIGGKINALCAVGQNLLDPVSKTARLLPYAFDGHDNEYTIKNIPSGATVTFTPDGSSEASSVVITDSHFTIAKAGVLTLSAATEDTYVCATYDENKDDDVVPYEKFEKPFDFTKVYGKAEGSDTYTQVFPNGMRGAGSVHDLIDLQSMTADVNIGSQNLGDLTYTQDAGTTRYYGVLPSGKNAYYRGTRDTNNSNCIISTPKYRKGSLFNINDQINNTYSCGLDGHTNIGSGKSRRVYIVDSSAADAAALKTSLANVFLWYELATPAHYTDCVYRDNGVDTPLQNLTMLVDNWGTESQEIPYTDNDPKGMCVGVSAIYGIDAAEAIESLPSVYTPLTTYNSGIEKKANKSGYYSELSVGSADNLNGQNADTDTWEERPVGGEGSEVATGLASVQAVGGNGVVYNQLCKISTDASFTSNDVIFTNNGDGTWTLNGTASANTFAGLLDEDSNIRFIAGHKYYMRGSCGGGFRLFVESGAVFSQSYVDTGGGVIMKCSNSGSLRPWSQITSGSSFTNARVAMQVFDLTLYGIDTYTKADIEAWLAQNLGVKLIYARNAGTLLPAKLQGYKTTGKSANLLNPTEKEARLVEYTYNVHNFVTVKNLPSDASLRFVPDNTGVAVELPHPSGNGVPFQDNDHYVYPSQGTLKVVNSSDPTQAYSGSGDLSKTWVVLTYDGAMDDYDNFEAWDGKEYAFDTSKVYGKLNGAGDYVQVFPNGMRGVGSARDALNLMDASADVNIGSVDLGGEDVSWNKNTSFTKPFFTTTSLPIKKVPSNAYAKLLCEKPYKIERSYLNGSDFEVSCIFVNSIGVLEIQDINYYDSTKSQFKTAMNGVMLFYELATPQVYTDCVYRDNGVDTPLSELNILVNNWAYEQAVVAQQADEFSTEKAYAIGDYVTYSDVQYRFTAAKTAGAWDSTKVTADASPVSCAAQSTILYGIDCVEQLDTLKETGIDIDAMRSNLDALLTAMQTAGIIGGYTLGATPTNKVFSISITAPTTEE